MSSTKSGIYQILCTANNKIYTGSALIISKRWREHRFALKHNIHKNRHLNNAWNKYGKEAFEWSVVEYCLTDDLEARETYWDNTVPPNLRFNIRPISGSNRGVKRSNEVRANKSKAMLGNIPTEETCRKISEANKGRKHSKQWRERTSKSMTNVVGKQVQQLDLQSGEVIATYESITQARDITGINNISRVCNFVGNHVSAGGFGWKFA